MTGDCYNEFYILLSDKIKLLNGIYDLIGSYEPLKNPKTIEYLTKYFTIEGCACIERGVKELLYCHFSKDIKNNEVLLFLQKNIKDKHGRNPKMEYIIELLSKFSEKKLTTTFNNCLQDEGLTITISDFKLQLNSLINCRNSIAHDLPFSMTSYEDIFKQIDKAILFLVSLKSVLEKEY